MADRKIVVASIMPRRGQTGVQTHTITLIESASGRAAGVELVTPFDVSPLLFVPAFAPGRMARPFSRSAWVWWYRESHRRILAFALDRKLADLGPAIIYAQDPVSAAAALDLRRRGHAVEVILAVHFNGSQADEWVRMGNIRPEGTLYRGIKQFEREILTEMDGLVFVSEYALRETLRDIPEVVNVPTWCVPNFARDPGARDTPGHIEAELLCIGSLEPRKNQAFALRVLAALHARGAAYRLSIVGFGPSEDALKSLARELGIERSVHFRGFVPDASSLFRTHRACLHTATMENMPITLLEALAAGRPIFAPAVGGIPEIFDEDVEGRFIDTNDPDSAAASILEVLEAPSRYRAMCNSARARYERDFTAERVVPRLLGAIMKISRVGSAG